MAKSKLGRKGFLWLTLSHCSLLSKEIRVGTQAGRNLKVEAGAKSTEGCYLLACSSWHPYRNQDYHPHFSLWITKRVFFSSLIYSLYIPIAAPSLQVPHITPPWHNKVYLLPLRPDKALQLGEPDPQAGNRLSDGPFSSSWGAYWGTSIEVPSFR